MSEPFDVYSDSTGITISDWGTNLQFYVRGIVQPAAEGPDQIYLGTVRMSNEHVKVLLYLLRDEIRQHEAEAEFQFEVPKRTLTAFNIDEEDWQAFWEQAGG
jgi:hypothetical protein